LYSPQALRQWTDDLAAAFPSYPGRLQINPGPQEKAVALIICVLTDAK
jgi:hypothetical protein